MFLVLNWWLLILNVIEDVIGNMSLYDCWLWVFCIVIPLFLALWDELVYNSCQFFSFSPFCRDSFFCSSFYSKKHIYVEMRLWFLFLNGPIICKCSLQWCQNWQGISSRWGISLIILHFDHHNKNLLVKILFSDFLGDYRCNRDVLKLAFYE